MPINDMIWLACVRCVAPSHFLAKFALRAPHHVPRRSVVFWWVTNVWLVSYMLEILCLKRCNTFQNDYQNMESLHFNEMKWFLGDHLWTIPHSSMGMKSTYILKPNTKAQNGMCWPLPINIKNNAQANVRGQIETLNSQMTINITSFINFQRWSHSLSNVIKRAINWIEMWKMIFENSCFGYKCGGHFPIFIFPNDDEGKFWSSHKWYWSLVNNFSNVSKTINPNIVDYKKEPTLDVTIKNQWTCVTKKNTMSI